MRRPKKPEAYVAMTLYLTRPRPVLWLRDGTTLAAPKGMACMVVHVGNPKFPRVLFPAFRSQSHIGYEVPWGSLTEKEPMCKCCKQSVSPDDLVPYKKK